MIARRTSEARFKRLTVDEYLQGGYGLDREQAEELAAQEWNIRQEVENTKPHSARIKSSNSRHGFGKNAILIKREKKLITSWPTRSDIKSENAGVKTVAKPKRKKTAAVGNCAGVATPTGVIDAGYTGSISVVLVSKYDLRIFRGNRIAQLVIVPLPDVHLVEGDVTGVKSERGLGGFGSSGL